MPGQTLQPQTLIDQMEAKREELMTLPRATVVSPRIPGPRALELTHIVIESFGPINDELLAVFSTEHLLSIKAAYESVLDAALVLRCAPKDTGRQGSLHVP